MRAYAPYGMISNISPQPLPPREIADRARKAYTPVFGMPAELRSSLRRLDGYPDAFAGIAVMRTWRWYTRAAKAGAAGAECQPYEFASPRNKE